MELISIIGAFLVTLALLAYGVGSASLQRFKIVNNSILVFLTLGILLDIAATICMIIGSQNTPFTIHGFLGYSAFLAMFIDVILVWNYKRINEESVAVGKSLLIYSKMAYGWWVVAYITGSLLVIL